MSDLLFDDGARSAYQRYAERLSDAIRYRDWVGDPSFALKSDATIYEKVLRDPVTAHAIRFRKHLVAGAEVRVEGASDRPEDQAAAAVVEELLGNVMGFTDARISLAEAIFRGSAYAFVSGTRRVIEVGTLPGGGAAPPQNWWVPERLVDVDRRRFRLVRPDPQRPLAWEFWSAERSAWEALAHPEWFIRSVHEDTEGSLSYGRGLLDTLYYCQSLKARLVQDAASAAERFGQGLIKVAVEGLRGADGRPVGGDQRDGDSVASAWQEVMTRHRARHVLVHDSRDEVEVLQGIGEGAGLIKQLLDYVDNALVTTVLGSTLPTLEGDGGSRALGEVQENSTEALVQADRARLADDLTRDLVGLLWRLNRPQLEAQVGRARMPRVKIDQRKREDPDAAAELIAKLLAAGVALRKDEVYDKVGFTVPLPGEDVIEGAGGVVPQLGGLGGLPTLPPTVDVAR